eukprot:TRINITY_DN1535_c0_g1_i1.p1 TRINITY_DN1535_c0_g1~~TRINITY_DN1535_c0_g1_i1.p1  ORF type:complete len:218 (-),score=8.16 TRINITY_DN1535_c0_g1_i1:406-1059(-)
MGRLRLWLLVGILLPIFSSTGTASLPLESPVFAVLHVQEERQFEIRRYENCSWIAAPGVEDFSFVRATQIGLKKLLDWWPTFLPSTEPVVTGIRPSDGPFCATTFSVRLYLPGEYAATVVPPKDIQIERWGKQQCFAVRPFEDPAQDANVAQQASRLAYSLRGTPWESIIDNSSAPEEYIIAQYGATCEACPKHSEVWILVGTSREDCLPQSFASQK